MGRKRRRKRASKSTDSDKSPKSESEAKRRSSSSTQSKRRRGPLDGTAAFDQGIGNDINALTGQPEGFDAMAGSNTPDFEPLPTGPDAHIQRALEGTDTTRDEVPGTVLDVLGQGGKPLDGPIQRALEERMDADFSNVRIHTGAKAAEAADAIGAKAFTCGNDIVFNSGEYNPESGEGQFLLAHELAHVKQQTGAAISMMPQEGGLQIDPDPQLEREADEAAMQVLSGEEPATVQRLGTDIQIQKMDINAILPLLAAAPHLTPQLASLMQVYGPKAEEDLEEHKDLLKNGEEIDWVEASYEGVKEDAGRIPQLVTELPGLKAIKETVNNAKEQRQDQREPTFQEQLEEAALPKNWKDELLEDFELPEDLRKELVEEARQAVEDATGASSQEVDY
ncbi:hypothetical protein C483_17138 [Natrialba hulunbeirensis JCM 10989]|uniref:eCIS core domain-containing protein n=1 Tax=Natrialba hulunbeirensis JCM 10989 TaxID=1227493 RepID=L9ZMA7_9EURY|nr:DUF4157 domain-containing protein [Natrialba hulunbeirensis]ELY87645.1 hypothetical protein C483_17138 [Natrialba hulunbeirensis JCM 10989]